jgi:hypothetical protein
LLTGTQNRGTAIAGDLEAAGFSRSGKRYAPTSTALAAEAVIAMWEKVGKADDPKRLRGLNAR